ncbi:MAG: RagB/SusD family nutrient uptake outer membrane protein [Flavitalea sp.]
MKNIIVSTILLSFLITSCNKELKYVDTSAINPNIFPKTAKDVQAMVNACYYPVRGAWWDGINTTSERGLMMTKELQTGVLRGGVGGDDGNITSMNYNPQSENVTFFYDFYHNSISTMTSYISTIEKSTIEMTDQERQKALAEMHTARALLCYDLFDLYGPIVVAPLEALENPLKDQPLPRMEYAEMVNFIEADLQAGVQGLPDPADVEYGRFSSGLARMLLIRLYLHEKKWDKVLAQCDTIITQNQYSLDPDYVGMWGVRAGQNSPEVIWAIPCDYGATSENQWQMMALPGNYPLQPGYGAIQSSWWFYDSFEANDVRKTNLIVAYTGSDGVDYNRQNPSTFLNYGPRPLKMDGDWDRTSELSEVDIIEYRYADVLLSKAEAIANLSGPTQEAMDLVNQIRNRANLSNFLLADYASLDKFIDMLLMERGHEFWCENGEYRADLIRYNKLTERIKLIAGDQFVEDAKILFPFSLKNIIEGKGAFVQNPGYN